MTNNVTKFSSYSYYYCKRKTWLRGTISLLPFGINVTLIWPLLPRYVKQTAIYHVRNTAGNYFCHCLCKHNIYQKVKTKDISSTHRKRFHIPNYFVFLRNILHNPNWSLKKIKYRDEWCSHDKICRRQFNERTTTLLALLQPEEIGQQFTKIQGSHFDQSRFFVETGNLKFSDSKMWWKQKSKNFSLS